AGRLVPRALEALLQEVLGGRDRVLRRDRSVTVRKATREERDVGRQRPRGRAVRALEDDALATEPVDARARGARVAVDAEAVRPQAGDREEEDVPGSDGFASRRRAAVVASGERAGEEPREYPRRQRTAHGASISVGARAPQPPALATRAPRWRWAENE